MKMLLMFYAAIHNFKIFYIYSGFIKNLVIKDFRLISR